MDALPYLLTNNMKVIVNNEEITLFEGAMVEHAIRKHSPQLLEDVKRGALEVVDQHGHAVSLNGRLAEGSVLHVPQASNTSAKSGEEKSNLWNMIRRLFSTSKYLLCLLFASLIVVSCETNKKEVEIVILSTNDIHAKIDNFPKVAAYIAKMRTEHPNVLVLNAGDMFSGNPVVDQYSEKGYPIIDIMNKIGYDFTTIGNHEFDYGQEMMKKRMEQANFKWICANMQVTPPEGIIPQPEPYAITTVGGVKIALLGIVEVSSRTGIPSTHPDRVKGIKFTNPIKKAQEYKSLRKQCDVFIGLTHIGADEDAKLAEVMPELDVIIGGHTHTRIDSIYLVNNVLITQTDSWLKYIGKTTLVLKGKKIISKRNELIPVKDLAEEDLSLANDIKKYYDESGLNVVVAQNVSAINGKEPLGCLMTDAITALPDEKIDIAFQNKGGVRMSRLAKGDITKATVLELDPFGNEVIVYKMTPEEIRDLVYNASASHGGEVDLYVSGITYTIPKKGKAKDVVLKLYNGKLLDEKKQYTVGMNSYIASSYKFKGNDAGRSLYITSADVLMSYLEKVRKVDYAKTKRASVE